MALKISECGTGLYFQDYAWVWVSLSVFYEFDVIISHVALFASYYY